MDIRRPKRRLQSRALLGPNKQAQKVAASVLQRPPASTPSATKRQRSLPRSSGYVASFRRRASSKATGREGSRRERAAPSGDAMVVSTASCAPCHKGKPLAMTSMQRSSNRLNMPLKSRRNVLVGERATTPAVAGGQRRETKAPQEEGTQVVGREGQLRAGGHAGEGAASDLFCLCFFSRAFFRLLLQATYIPAAPGCAQGALRGQPFVYRRLPAVRLTGRASGMRPPVARVQDQPARCRREAGCHPRHCKAPARQPA